MEQGWLALEFNDPTFDATNLAQAPAFVEACELNGILPVAWFTRPLDGVHSRSIVDRFGFRAAIVEGEIPAEELTPYGPRPYAAAQDWREVVAAFEGYAGDCAVATSWSPFQSYVWDASAQRWILHPNASFAAPLIQAGWYVLPYVYPAENLGATIGSQLAYAQHFTHEAAPSVLEQGQGWYHPEPVLGCYGGFTLNDFPERGGTVGYSIWDAGEVL